MKTLTPAMLTHISGEVTNLRTCWKVTLTGGATFCFTDHVEDLTVSGLTYIASTGYTPTTISSNASLAVDNLEVQGVIDSNVLTEEDLQSGLWDFASVEVFQVNYLNLAAGVIRQHRGKLGEVRMGRAAFVAELRGLSQQMQQTIGDLYTPTCRANLGDAKCGVNLASITVSGTVSTAASQLSFTDPLRAESAGYFDGGLVSWTSGLNTGLAMEVKSFAAATFTLYQPMYYLILPGDTFTVYPGCRKRFVEDCIGKFNNAVNFRGEPHVPGNDQMLQVGGL